MLYEFRSRVGGTVVMTGPVAEQLLAVIGKEAGPQGIFTVAQLADAIAALQAAVEREKAEGKAQEDEDEAPRGAPRAVTLAQRAWPLIDLMQTALRKEQPVTWGV